MIALVSQYLIEHKSKWNFADFEYMLSDALVLKCFDDDQRDIYRQKIEYGFRYFVPEMADFDQYLSKMGKRWQKMFVKKSRIMERDGEVKIAFSSSQKSTSSALSDLAKMHCSRWKEKTGECIFDSQRFYHFHEKILERLVPQNKAFIKTISLAGEDLASYYVFTDKNKIHYYQSGFFSEYANRYSPLFLLVCNEVGDAIKNNKQFDFMYADNIDSYKKEQYAANYERMYRLKWSTHPFRFFVFDCVKVMQNRMLKVLKK
jgi:CelD/BcsL family acetyltransferase involved in cellulose biosynthesis